MYYTETKTQTKPHFSNTQANLIKKRSTGRYFSYWETKRTCIVLSVKQSVEIYLFYSRIIKKRFFLWLILIAQNNIGCVE
jgi:hypothetical protein